MKDILDQKLEATVEHALNSHTAGKAERLMQSRLGLWILAAISFFESALPVPIITDPFMVAGILVDRSRAGLFVLVTLVSSLLGGVAAFAMAAYFFDIIAEYLMTPTIQAQFQSLVSFGASETFATTITGAITPIPYTITAWVVAVAGGSLWLFILGSLIGRSVRYGIVGYCTYQFGPAALLYARRSLAITSLIIFILIGFYIWLKL